jgi:hypothetical protein
VPDGLRAANGTYLHDDLVLSASLTAILDRLRWHVRTETQSVQQFDPLLRKQEILMTVAETEDTITLGRREFDNTFRNRMEYDRQKVFRSGHPRLAHKPVGAAHH